MSVNNSTTNGYTWSGTDIMGAFNRNAGGKTVLDNAVDNTQTVVQKISNTQHLAKVSGVNISALKPDTTNANPNQGAMMATAMQSREQVASALAGFKAEVQDIQSKMDMALAQACEILHLDPKAAADTINRHRPLANSKPALSWPTGEQSERQL